MLRQTELDIKSNISLYSLYYAKAFNEFVWSTSALLCLWETQLLSKICRSGGKLFATLRTIWPLWDLNLRALTLELKTLLLDQLAGKTWNLTTLNHTITIKKRFIFAMALIAWVGSTSFQVSLLCAWLKLFVMISSQYKPENWKSVNS